MIRGIESCSYNICNFYWWSEGKPLSHSWCPFLYPPKWFLPSETQGSCFLLFSKLFAFFMALSLGRQFFYFRMSFFRWLLSNMTYVDESFLENMNLNTLTGKAFRCFVLSLNFFWKGVFGNRRQSFRCCQVYENLAYRKLNLDHFSLKIIFKWGLLACLTISGMLFFILYG